MKTRILILLIVLLFGLRICYGLCCYWMPDNLQIYLLGLKYYTTGLWPYFGPDVTYTDSQIPGALQGLLVGLPLYILSIPESPFFVLQVMVLASQVLLVWYVRQRLPAVPGWLVWLWLMSAPWAMAFSTIVVNPSYVLPFATLFFVCLLELLPLYRTRVISPYIAAGAMGLCVTAIMQLHMSWVLLVPYSLVALLYQLREDRRRALRLVPIYLCGLCIGAITLLPTISRYGVHSTGGTEKNVVFMLSNLKRVGDIFLRFLSFASFEVNYVMLAVARTSGDITAEQVWMLPIVIVLTVVGWVQVVYFSFCFFLKSELPEWKPLKVLVLATIGMVSLSFLFSLKGPSPHTFYMLFPLSMFYSLYCYQRLLAQRPVLWQRVFGVMVVLGVLFHIGIARYAYSRYSLYTDRARVVKAITDRDYKIVGRRRADDWGYGY